MSVEKKDVLQGVVISKFGDMGPESIGCYPALFDDVTLSEISIKAVSILAGEDGAIPLNLSILPLPKLKMTAVIQIFDIKDETARGGAITHTLSILFKEKYTPVIYKLMDDLGKITIPETLVEAVEEKQDLTEFLSGLYHQIDNVIYSQQKDEVTRFTITPGGEKKYAQKYAFKLIVIGDPRVGKTTLILRYTDKAFRELYIPTLGVQVSMRYVEVDQNTQVKLNIWDIAGQELFNQIRGKFYTGSHAVLIVYDVTNPKTFNSVERWYKDMIKTGEKPGFLIGNKIDLPAQVNKLDAKNLADKLGLEYVETSAKTGENVDLVFQKLAEKLIPELKEF